MEWGSDLDFTPAPTPSSPSPSPPWLDTLMWHACGRQAWGGVNNGGQGAAGGHTWGGAGAGDLSPQEFLALTHQVGTLFGQFVTENLLNNCC